MNSIELQQRLIKALHHTACYPHEVDSVEVIETHISWIVLAGPFAYKLKKALNLGFLDYSTLERRHYCCEEELRLNQRTAPSLYLEVVTIDGSVDHPRINGNGPVIEWAIKMQRFEQQQLASVQLSMQTLTAVQMEQLGYTIARFHRLAPSVPADATVGNHTAVIHPIEENFCQIREQLSDPALLLQLSPLQEWFEEKERLLSPLLEKRKQEGFIRECHGDLHLNNIVLLDGVPSPFDGIEFNENLRYVDVVSDIAFLLMDLDYRGRSDLGWAFLDSYLQESGDYGGLALLRFYQIYRAMVRAKVAAIRSNQSGLSSTARQEILAEVAAYLQLAQSYTRPTSAHLLLLHGFSGAGKSSVAHELLQVWGAVRLRSDVERKRLHGLSASSASRAALDSGIYSADASQRTYAQLAWLSGELLDNGFNVIVDATFLRQSERQRFIVLATEHARSWHLLDITASNEIMRARIIQRHRQQHDASEADLDVLAYQLAHHDPLGAEERRHTLHIDTEERYSVKSLLPRLSQPT